jgi:hypothetical protein
MIDDTPVAFETKKLSTAECNYPTQERALLAILHALRTWRCFIDGRQYDVYNDHNQLQIPTNQEKSSTKISAMVQRAEVVRTYDQIQTRQ